MLLGALALSACATPVRYTDPPLGSYDNTTDYRIDDQDGGFTVTIYYSRYQFIPESAAVAVACKSALTAIAHEIVGKRGKVVRPINERTRCRRDENGFTGITSCSATVPVECAS